jgi:hypothetical protein
MQSFCQSSEDSTATFTNRIKSVVRDTQVIITEHNKNSNQEVKKD